MTPVVPPPAGGDRVESSVVAFARDIKLEHSVFALPFAFIGCLSAVHVGAGAISWRLAGLVLAAMFFARTAAMGFNRWHDAKFDAQNERTKNRAIPAGRLSRPTALAFTLSAAALFVLVAFVINRTAGFLSPVALLVILGYSTTKRWTSASHLVLGLSLAMAPAGGWIAVAGSLESRPMLLAAAVLCWVTGFDILYALMDLEFDRRSGLYSIPARFGERFARLAAQLLHGIAFVALVLAGRALGLGIGWFSATAVVAICLVAQHLLSRDRTKIPQAFFHLNAGVGFIMLAGFLFDTLP